jgi:glutaminyl-peptide cyclotransferase
MRFFPLAARAGIPLFLAFALPNFSVGAEPPLAGETVAEEEEEEAAGVPLAFGPAFAAELAGKFDAKRAFADLERQVAMGPRVPGSASSSRFLDWLERELRAAGLEPERQEFMAPDALAQTPVHGTNLIAHYRPDAPRHVLLSCHWDCRRRADRDPNPALRKLPVDGANDGASGVAVLLEIARALQARPLPQGLGVMLVFFDVEDQGAANSSESFCMGSMHFADNFDYSLDVKAAINIDMIGDADLRLGVEEYSLNHAPDVVDAVWTVGEELFPAIFHRGNIGRVFDDHVRLQQIGLPAIDMIDFQYDRWHTTRDLPEACSSESLRATGQTLLTYLGRGAESNAPR